MSATKPAARTTVDGRPTPIPASTEPLPRDRVVRVSSLTMRHDEVVAVDEITFSLEAGTVTGYLGPNGAGDRSGGPDAGS
jgi:hypothetical protein